MGYCEYCKYVNCEGVCEQTEYIYVEVPKPKKNEIDELKEIINTQLEMIETLNKKVDKLKEVIKYQTTIISTLTK